MVASHEGRHGGQVREDWPVSRWGNLVLSAVLLLATALVVPWYWEVVQVPLRPGLWYSLGWVWTIIIPGWVMYRIVAGKPRDVLTDVGMGAAFGLVASTFVWLLLVAIGGQSLFIAWPVIPLLASIPVRRRVYRFGAYERGIHPLSIAAFCLAVVVSITDLASSALARSVLPPSHNGWHGDAYWHMGLVWELGRAMPPQDPQVAGDPLWYHWFSNAHVAAQSHVAGVDPTVGFLGLWQPFIYVLVLALMLVAGRELTGRIWPGAIAALLMAAGTGLGFSWFGLFGMDAFNVHSPSQQYSLVPMLLCLIGVIQVLRTRQRTLPTVVFVVGALGCMGSKGSALPVVVCGLGLALLVAWLMDRRRVRPLAVLLTTSVLAFGISMVLTSSANAGTRLQLFSSIRRTAPWSAAFDTPLISLEPVIPGLDREGGPLLLMLILGSYAIMYGATWLGVPLLRRSVAPWFLLGVGIAGFSAMNLVNQDGLSQVYFMSGAVPAILLLAAAGVHAAMERARAEIGSQRALLWAGAFLGLGGLLVAWTQGLFDTVPEPDRVNASVGGSVAVYTTGIVLLLALAWFINRRLVWLAAAGLLLGGQIPGWNTPVIEDAPLVTPALVVAVGCALGLYAARRHARLVHDAAILCALVLAVHMAYVNVTTGTDLTRETRRDALTRSLVSTPETEAGLWVQQHLPTDTLLATNVHCDWAPERADCVSKGFWVSALTGRRVLLGGWAYTPAAHQAHGRDGLLYSQQPFDDQELYELNQRAFTDPNESVLEELRERGVDHLFVATRYTEVSPELDQLATEVFRNDDVVIYDLG